MIPLFLTILLFGSSGNIFADDPDSPSDLSTSPNMVAPRPDSPFFEEWVLGKSAISADEDQLRRWFQEAPSILPDAKMPLKPLPLWHTDGEFSEAVIHEILDGGKENGFGGITFLPLSGTYPKYLTEEYFDLYGKVLQRVDDLGMKLIYYDDVDFPSGSAGGHLKEKFPQSTMKRLDKVEWRVTGPSEFREKSPIPLGDRVFYGRPEGVLQAAVAMNLETFERVDLRDAVSEDGTVSWQVPEGDWKIFLFFCVSDPIQLVDYMSPSAVQNFLSLTYEPSYQRFAKHFGTTITAFFFDDLTNTGTRDSRNWTLGFNDKYRELFGKDPTLDYPALFYSIGPDTPVARYRFWTTRNTLFADGYPKLVRQWRVEHGIDAISTGHPQGPYVIQPIDTCGDAIASHRNSDAVLFDAIHYYGHGRDGFKLPTSAAFNFDYPLCFVEIYGDFRDHSFNESIRTTFDASTMNRAVMEIFARGGNLILPHGIWSHPEGTHIPPEISWRNPNLAGTLANYGDFVSRTSLLLQGGRHIADFGFVYPVDNLKAFFHFQLAFLEKGFPVNGDYPYGILLPRETDYLAIGSDFSTRIWRDFTFLHPDTITQKCSVTTLDGEPVFRLNNRVNYENYRAVVLTGAEMISWSNMEKILAFYRAGGRILATTRLPFRASEGPDFDDRVRAAVEEIFGIDPTRQALRESLRTGQEDICLPKNFRHVREINIEGEYIPTIENPIVYEDPIYRDRAVFLPRPTTDALRAAADYLVPTPDVRIEPATPGGTLPVLTIVPRWDYEPEGMLQYIHKEKNGLDVYYFANSSNETADFIATLRGTFQTLEFWDPDTGATIPIPSDSLTVSPESGVTSVHVTLPKIDSVFVVGKR